MERNDTISGALAIFGFIIMIGGLLMGWFYAQIGGGILYFIIVTLIGVAIGMLFIGLAAVLTQLDNVAMMLAEKSKPEESKDTELSKEPTP